MVGVLGPLKTLCQALPLGHTNNIENISFLQEKCYKKCNRKLNNWDFYFRALGSLVVLSFPQLLSFSSVLPNPLSETLTRSSDGRNPI
jgi:hypothetical protein